MSRQILQVGIAAALVALAIAAWFGIGHRKTMRLPVSMAATSANAASQGPTVIEVGSSVLHSGVKRFGMNLGGENYYDSEQVLKNLVSTNPGFEGEQWQSVMQCGRVTPTSCTDGANSGAWSEGLFDGGTYEVISGAAMGKSGTIVHSTAGGDHVGTTIQFSDGSPAPAANDFIVVRKTVEGKEIGGWQAQAGDGGSVTAEYKDLSPRTAGTRAVRLSALPAHNFVSLKQYFDSSGHSYVLLRGPYIVRFRAKGTGGNKKLHVGLSRLGSGNPAIFEQDLQLTSQWQDYTLNFNAAEPADATGTLAFAFSAYESEVLLDDASLTEASPNGTAFRNAMVSTLERLRPGVLRYMDSAMWGSSLDNLLAPEGARKRTGWGRYDSKAGDMPIGTHDFLVLCEKLGAEPWYTMPVGTSEEEAANLAEYLGGSTTTKYGALRAKLGHPVPWTQTFKTIHIEFGNETWNTAQPGASMADPEAYAARTTAVFKSLRSSSGYSAERYDLVADGQAVNTWLNHKILETVQGIDTIDIGPYTFNTFGDDSSIENIFGPMFAEPQMLDSASNGYVHGQANAAATAVHPVHLAVYETNIGTTMGTASQASVNATVPSLGAGISSINHMLLMLRDLGITVQNTFQLGGGNFHFANTAGKDNNETSPVWSVVVDMGGAANRVRPSFLAQQLANEAIRPTMLPTTLTGADPTWDQAKSANDDVELGKVHELQSYAFSDDTSSTLIVFNLSRTTARSVGLAGACAPQGEVKIETLASAQITDNNEHEEKVKVVSRVEHGVVPGQWRVSLPPFSMTTLSSTRGAGCGKSELSR